jgi:predicted nucleic acid-binding protein
VVEELQKGLSRLKRIGASAKTVRLEAWMDDIFLQFGERILEVDAAVAQLAGEMEDAAAAKGRNPGLADVLIAATAKRADLAVGTANLRHFAALDVRCFDPSKGDHPPR